MDRRHTGWTLRSGALALLAVVILLAMPDLSSAQQPSAAELTRVIGRVEVLRKGQPQWVAAVIGARLVEGDDIRAFSGASAELTLPDTSTIVLAENSRLLLSKLEFDQKNQTRTVLVHLAIGKMRAVIAQAAIALVRARQSNFAITTPTAVAAARGTVVWAGFDGVNGWFAVEPQVGIPSRVDCLQLRGVSPGQVPKAQTIFAGSMAMNCGTPVQIQPQFLTFNNNATANADLGAVVVAPPPALVLQLITAGVPSAPTTFFTSGPIEAGGSPPTARDALITPPGPPEFTPLSAGGN